MENTFKAPFGFSDSATANPANRMSGTFPQVQTGSILHQDLQPAPINPDWILEGDPIAKATTLAIATDNTLSCAVWECSAGKFQWVFGLDEIVQILEGEVMIEEQNSGRKVHRLRAGDIALFPDGLTAHWTVARYVKKFAIHRTIPRSIVWRFKRKMRHLLGLVTKDGMGCYGAMIHFETAVETLSMA